MKQTHRLKKDLCRVWGIGCQPGCVHYCGDEGEGDVECVLSETLASTSDCLGLGILILSMGRGSVSLVHWEWNFIFLEYLIDAYLKQLLVSVLVQFLCVRQNHTSI